MKNSGMTVAELIDAFGGTTSTAKLFGVNPSAVSNWKAANRFPDRLHYRIAVEMQARGLEISPELFGGLSPSDATAAARASTPPDGDDAGTESKPAAA